MIFAKERFVRFRKEFIKSYQLLLLALPLITYFIIFKYIPMYGVQIAFKDFVASKGIWGSGWVGALHLKRFVNSTDFRLVLSNTVLLSGYNLLVGFPVPILLALMLNSISKVWFKKTVQTAIYAPHFISTVVLVGMINLFLSPSSGLVNKMIQYLGHEKIMFMGEPGWFKTIYVFSDIWKNAGWDSIIYIAALANINPEFHEAAMVDGASRFQILKHIELPSILPTAITLLILKSGHILSVDFEKAYLMQNSLNRTASEIINTYVYKTGVLNANYGYATAIGLFQSVISLMILLTVNKLSKKYSETSIM